MDIEKIFLEKHLDQRGLLIEIIKDNKISNSIKQVYFSISKPHAILGNHYHVNKIEWFSVVKGTAKIICEDHNTKEKEELILSSDGPSVIKINPLVSHAIQNIGEDDMYLIIVANVVFDPNHPDIHKVNLI